MSSVPPPASVVDLWAIDDLRGIAVDGGSLALGALTTYTDIRRSALCREHVPALVEAAATIGAAQIQNRGTLGGNIANASPAGDTLPVLLAADAVFVVGSERGEREVPAAEFWTAYRQTALAHDELVLRILIPLAAAREIRFRKVGTRRAQSISKVVLAAAWRGDGTWRDVRVALGSVAATPIRAHGTEEALEGQPADTRDRRPGGGDAGRRAGTHRRRPLDRGVPPPRGRARPAPHDPRRRRLVTPARARPWRTLFEGAPRFLDRLEAAGPFESTDLLFHVARDIAHAMPEDDQIELIDAHPRLGAPPGTVSAMSYVEQGYDRGTAAPLDVGGRTRATQRRLRRQARLPVLRVRRGSTPRGAAPRDGRRARRRPHVRAPPRT